MPSFGDLFKRKQVPAPQADQLLNPRFYAAGDNASASPGRGSWSIQTAYIHSMRDMEARFQLYRTNPWVGRCIDLIAGAASKGYRLMTVDEKEVNDAAIQGFLNDPNDEDSCETLRFKLFSNLLYAGICFIEVVRVGNDPDQVRSVVQKAMSAIGTPEDAQVEDAVGALTIQGVPVYARILPPWQIQVISDNKGTVTGYRQYGVGGNVVDFAPTDLLKIVHPASMDLLYGNPPIERCETTAIADNFTRERQKNLLKNSAALDKIFTVKGNPQPADFERLRKELKTRYSGTRAAGNYLIAGEDVTVQEFDRIAEGDFLELRQAARDEIALAFGVPIPILGDSAGGGLDKAGMDNHYRVFIEQTVRPLVAHVERIFNRELIAPFTKGTSETVLLDITLEDAEDSLELENLWNMRLANGSSTINEVRALRGDPPLTTLVGDASAAVGDIAYIAAKGTPMAVNDLGKEPPPPPPSPFGAMNAIGKINPAGDDDDDEDEKQTKKALRELKSAMRTLRKSL